MSTNNTPKNEKAQWVEFDMRYGKLPRDEQFLAAVADILQARADALDRRGAIEDIYSARNEWAEVVRTCDAFPGAPFEPHLRESVSVCMEHLLKTTTRACLSGRGSVLLYMEAAQDYLDRTVNRVFPERYIARLNPDHLGADVYLEADSSQHDLKVPIDYNTYTPHSFAHIAKAIMQSPTYTKEVASKRISQEAYGRFVEGSPNFPDVAHVLQAVQEIDDEIFEDWNERRKFLDSISLPSNTSNMARRTWLSLAAAGLFPDRETSATPPSEMRRLGSVLTPFVDNHRRFALEVEVELTLEHITFTGVSTHSGTTRFTFPKDETPLWVTCARAVLEMNKHYSTPSVPWVLSKLDDRLDKIEVSLTAVRKLLQNGGMDDPLKWTNTQRTELVDGIRRRIERHGVISSELEEELEAWLVCFATPNLPKYIRDMREKEGSSSKGRKALFTALSKYMGDDAEMALIWSSTNITVHEAEAPQPLALFGLDERVEVHKVLYQAHTELKLQRELAAKEAERAQEEKERAQEEAQAAPATFQQKYHPDVDPGEACMDADGSCSEKRTKDGEGAGKVNFAVGHLGDMSLTEAYGLAPGVEEELLGYDAALAAAKKETPYRKTIKGVSVDLYDILEAYDVPYVLGHAIKKLMVPGTRSGGKSYKKDLQDAIWTIQRALEMADD